MKRSPQNPLWESILGFFIERKFVVFIAVAVMLFGSLSVAPFSWGPDDLPRDPVPVDAIPDIGENQQIIFTRWPGRSPRDIEDQITYPLTTTLLGVPGVKTVRSFSMLGFSTIYVIFNEDVEFYWSRARLLEKLSSLPGGTLPAGVAPTLGPDATALGQIFWYTLEGRNQSHEVTGGWDLHELRDVQDWQVRYALQSVPGVSEVASVGGYAREYQIDVDPEAMLAHGVTLSQIVGAVKNSNLDVGARTLEINQVEYIVRGVGFVKDLEDLEQVVIAQRNHTPIRVKDVAHVALGPSNRRGALDKAGAEAVGGVVVARFGENPLDVIERVKKKIEEISPGLPRKTLEDGTETRISIVPFYDRSTLIRETLETLSTALYQQILLTIIVVLVLLRHLRSSLLISAMLPLGMLASFLGMKWAGVDANVMSLAGIAIAIGTMVDMGIVLTENIVGRLEKASPEEDRGFLIREAAAEVAPAVLTSVATTVVSFLPIFALTASEGKLFKPLAYTKTFALLGSLGLTLVVLPALAHLILWSPVGSPEAPVRAPHWFRKAARAVLRAEHARDWLLVAAGASLAWFELPWIGLAVVLMGVLRMLKSLLAPRWSSLPGHVENVLAVVSVTALLAREWSPLGEGTSWGVNLGVLVLLLGGVLGSLQVFLLFYDRILAWALRHKLLFLSMPALFLVFGLTIWRGFDEVFGWLPEGVRRTGAVSALAHAVPGLGREFMPPFDEGSFLYMPTTMAHASIGESLETLKDLDAAIKTIPEVEEVVGKIGRVDSALDPAPISMVETVVTYKPEYRTEPDGTRVRQWREKIKTSEDIWKEITRVTERPGVTGAPILMPINARIVMLQSGMRASMGIKVKGPDLKTIEETGLELEKLLKEIPAIRPASVFAERIVGKPYLEIEIDREAIARCGLTIQEVQDVIQVALGGKPLTQTIEGRARYPVRVRYPRERRDSVEAIKRVLVPTPVGDQIPLEQLARIHYVRGPQVIKSEDTFLTGYVIFDAQPGWASADVVQQVEAFLQAKTGEGTLRLPTGVSYTFAGSYENQLRSEKRLSILVPLALALVFLLLYLQFGRVSTTLMIYTGVLVSVSGGFVLLWLYGQPWFLDFSPGGVDLRALFQVGPVNLSVAVWVGIIALVGIATDDGVVMATYLKQRFEGEKMDTVEEIRAAVLDAGKRRVRPCLMTTATTVLALLPVITSHGRGSDIMVPMSLPTLGGMSIELLTLFVVPVLYGGLEEVKLRLRKINPDGGGPG